MKGRHGQQLALSTIYGLKKDQEPFDPFEEADLANDMAARDRARDLLENEIDPLAGIDSGDNQTEVDLEEDDGYEAEEVEENEEKDEDDEYIDEVDALYSNDGSVKYKRSQLEAFKAGAPAGGMFAVIALAGSQHKVTVDDVLVVNKLKPVSEFALGTVHTLTDVLLVGSSHKTLVGLPIVSGAEVDVMVEEITRDAKVIIFKKRRRKHSQRKNGFRREVTMLRILDIRMPEPHSNHKHESRVGPDEEFLAALA